MAAIREPQRDLHCGVLVRLGVFRWGEGDGAGAVDKLDAPLRRARGGDGRTLRQRIARVRGAQQVPARPGDVLPVHREAFCQRAHPHRHHLRVGAFVAVGRGDAQARRVAGLRVWARGDFDGVAVDGGVPRRGVEKRCLDHRIDSIAGVAHRELLAPRRGGVGPRRVEALADCAQRDRDFHDANVPAAVLGAHRHRGLPARQVRARGEHHCAIGSDLRPFWRWRAVGIRGRRERHVAHLRCWHRQRLAAGELLGRVAHRVDGIALRRNDGDGEFVGTDASRHCLRGIRIPRGHRKRRGRANRGVRRRSDLKSAAWACDGCKALRIGAGRDLCPVQQRARLRHLQARRAARHLRVSPRGLRRGRQGHHVHWHVKLRRDGPVLKRHPHWYLVIPQVLRCARARHELAAGGIHADPIGVSGTVAVQHRKLRVDGLLRQAVDTRGVEGGQWDCRRAPSDRRDALGRADNVVVIVRQPVEEDVQRHHVPHVAFRPCELLPLMRRPPEANRDVASAVALDIQLFQLLVRVDLEFLELALIVGNDLGGHVIQQRIVHVRLRFHGEIRVPHPTRPEARDLALDALYVFGPRLVSARNLRVLPGNVLARERKRLPRCQV